MSAAARAARRPPAAPVHPAAPVLDLLADFGREQAAICIEASCAMFRGLETMRIIQQRAAQQAAARHHEAGRRLRQGMAPGELVALPWTLWQDELAAAAHCWQDLAAAALEAQTELLGCACVHAVDSEAALHGAAAMEALEAVPGVRTLVDSAAAMTRHALPH